MTPENKNHRNLINLDQPLNTEEVKEILSLLSADDVVELIQWFRAERDEAEVLVKKILIIGKHEQDRIDAATWLVKYSATRPVTSDDP